MTISTEPIAQGTVTCDECGKDHEANFSHVGGFDTPVAIYAVICTENNPQWLTDYYQITRVKFAEAEPPATV